MGVWDERLNWMREARSVASISREAGIPYRILLQVSGGRDMPSQYLPKATAFYQTESYRRLRAVGVPVREANRLRGGALGNIRYSETVIKRKVEEWTTGAFMSKFRKTVDQMSTRPERAFYDSVMEKIKRSLSKSQRETKYIEEYNIS